MSLSLSLSTTATIHRTALFRSQLISALLPPQSPTSKSPNPSNYPQQNPGSYLLLQHDFAFTYGKPSIIANYTPPQNCPSHNFAKIVLEWRTTCKGRQFDRIFGVWLGGVDLLRSCTAEPGATGINWTVKKDITWYDSLLKSNQTLAVYLGNLVDSTCSGVYHVNVSIHFYSVAVNPSFDEGNSGSGYDFKVDLIVPISRNLPLNDGCGLKSIRLI